jgi:hypothetical protein
MADIYVFADETGDLGYNSEKGSKYFGFGTASYTSGSFPNFIDAFKLRCELEVSGISIKEGFHATNDRWAIRDKIFNLITSEPPRFDFTFLNKENAYPSVKAKGDLHLYGLAWGMHLRTIAQQVASAEDVIYCIMGDIQTKAKKREIEFVVKEIAEQVPDRKIVPIIWNSKSSWGLQVADYGLWEAQRRLNNEKTEWWERCVQPNHSSFFLPWK